jgi:hypothetical protein
MNKIAKLLKTKEGRINLMQGWYLGCALTDSIYNITVFIV